MRRATHIHRLRRDAIRHDVLRGAPPGFQDHQSASTGSWDPTSSSAWRLSAGVLFGRHGVFDEGLRSCEDYDLWVRFLWGGERVGLLNEPLAYYRLRRGSLFDNRKLILQDTLFVIERAVDAVDTRTVPGLGVVLYERGRQALSVNDLPKASKFFRLAAEDPSLGQSWRLRARVGGLFPTLAARWHGWKTRANRSTPL